MVVSGVAASTAAEEVPATGLSGVEMAGVEVEPAVVEPALARAVASMVSRVVVEGDTAGSVGVGMVGWAEREVFAVVALGDTVLVKRVALVVRRNSACAARMALMAVRCAARTTLMVVRSSRHRSRN